MLSFQPVGKRLVLAVVVLAALWGAPASRAGAQQVGVGVVTNLAGSATVARTSTAQPLRFKDSVYGRDRIATAENSFLRVLLGGKAIVTVRELSELTLTGAGGLAGLDLSGGRMGLSVARQLMAPGEAIQVRTPNAVASVRGSVVIAEVSGGQGTGAVSLFNVLSGPVDIAAGGVSVRVGSRQRVRVSGGALGPVENLSDDDVSRLAADLKGTEPQHTDVGNEFQDDLTAREQTRALTYAPGSVEEQLSIGLEPPGNADLLRAPITPDINGVTGARAGGGGCSAKAVHATGVVKGKCVKPVATQPAQADAASNDLAADDTIKSAPPVSARPSVDLPKSQIPQPAAVKAVPKISVAPVDR